MWQKGDLELCQTGKVCQEHKDEGCMWFVRIRIISIETFLYLKKLRFLPLFWDFIKFYTLVGTVLIW